MSDNNNSNNQIQPDYLSTLLDNIPGITYRCKQDKHWTMCYMSPHTQEVTGFPAADFINNCVRSYASIIHPDDSQMVKEQVEKAIAEKCSWNFEYRILHKSGKVIWVHEQGREVFGDEHNYLDGFILDVTERKQSEFELFKMADIANQTDNAVVLTNIEGEIEWVNKGFESVSGYYLDEVKGKKPGDFLQGARTDAKAVKRMSTALARRQSFNEEVINYHKDGSIYYVQIRCNPFYDESGNCIGFMALEMDVSREKSFERQVFRQQQLLENMSEQARIGAWEVDMIKQRIYWSGMTRKIHQVDDDYKPDLTTAINFYKEGYSRDKISALVERAIKEGAPYSEELQIITAEGEELWVEATGQAEIRDGNCVRLYGSFRDINQRKLNELASAKNARHNQTLAELTVNPYVLSGDLQRVKKYILESICCALDVNRASIWLFEDDLSQMSLLAVYDEVNEAHLTPQVIKREQAPNYFQALFANASFCAPDVYQSEVTNELSELYLKPLNICSSFDALMFNGEEVIGVLCVEQVTHKHDWSQAEQGFVISVANLISGIYANEQRRLAEASLIEARDYAEKALRAKSEFLATMSHEIRTPMNGVLGMLDLVDHQELDSENSRKVNVARTSANALLSIINDILDFSKVEAGKIELERLSFSCKEFFQEFVDFMQPKAEQKGLTLAMTYEGDMAEDIVKGDPGRLRQILTNLVGNALKFTETGSIAIRYQLSKMGPGYILKVQVTDTGIGIEQEKLKQLFEPFTQADTSTTRKYGGTGLGLAICKRLCNMMGGHISAVSSPGQGSRFIFSAKLMRGNATELPQSQTINSQPKLGEQQARILLAEDNNINQEVALAMLRSFGFTAEVAANGQEAIDMMRTAEDDHPFQLILMDCQMPEVDGFEATHKIRQGEAGTHYEKIPIVALTANAIKGDKERCLEAGMDDYLSKPVNVIEFQEKVSHWLSQ